MSFTGSFLSSGCKLFLNNPWQILCLTLPGSGSGRRTFPNISGEVRGGKKVEPNIQNKPLALSYIMAHIWFDLLVLLFLWNKYRILFLVLQVLLKTSEIPKQNPRNECSRLLNKKSRVTMIKEVCAFLLPHLDAQTCSCHFPSSLPPPTVISISGKKRGTRVGEERV